MQKQINFVIIQKEVIDLSELMNESADIFNEDDINKPKQNIVVRIIKWIGLAIIIVIVSLLFYRCVSHFDHPIVKKVLMNEAFLECYEELGSSLEVRKYGMQKPWVDVYEREGRLIEFNNLYYIPATKQLQISLKYNEDIVPENFEGFPFRLSLVDEAGNEYTDFWYETAERERFRYLRVCFENVEIELDELDEKGRNKRHTLYIKMDVVKEDGTYDYLCMEGKHLIYDGISDKNAVYDLIEYKVK